MSQTYFAILTAIGEAKDANAKALGTQFVITHMGVGDGNGEAPTPDRTQTALVNEQRRAPLNQLSVDAENINQIIAEQVIPETEGGWWIREIGLYDEDGDLIAVANCPPTYKPQLAEGSGRTQVIRMVLTVSSAASIELKIDPSVVLATRDYVDQAIAGATIADASTTTKGKVELATVTETKTGTDASRAVTPAGLKGVIDADLVNKTSVQTTTNDAAFENDSGNPASTNWIRGAMLAIATAAGFDCLLASNGYIKFPSWLGGLIFQWGTATSVNGNVTWTFPVTFPNAAFLAAIVSTDTNWYSFYETSTSPSVWTWAGTVSSTGVPMPAGVTTRAISIGH